MQNNFTQICLAMKNAGVHARIKKTVCTTACEGVWKEKKKTAKIFITYFPFSFGNTRTFTVGMRKKQVILRSLYYQFARKEKQ